MVAKVIKFNAETGDTLTCKLYPLDSATIANGAGDAAAENATVKTEYSITVDEVITEGMFKLSVETTTEFLGLYFVYLKEIADNYWADISVAAAWNNARLTATRAANLDNLDVPISSVRDSIELQRRSHRATGNVYYVEPTSGNNGNAGTKAAPKATIAGALAVCTAGNHDTIILLSKGATGVTLVEQVTINKSYVHIRGPGQHFILQPNTNGDAIEIIAEGCEISGLQIRTHTAGSGRAIHIGSNAHKTFVNNCLISYARSHGILISDANDCAIENNIITGAGVNAASSGISLSSTTSIARTRIRNNYLINNTNIGISVLGANTTDTIIENNIVTHNTSWGIIVTSAVRTILADNNVSNNTVTNISDGGTSTVDSFNSEPARREEFGASGTIINTTKGGYLDAAISSRATTSAIWSYSTTFLGGDLTTVGGIIKTQLDANVASRMATFTYTAPDNTGITTLLGRITDARATKLDNLDATITSRLSTAGYTAPDNTGISTLTTRLSDARATKLDNLDAAITSRLSTAGYTAPDNTGITTLVGRLTSTRAGNLDNLDAAISTRMATFTYTAPDNANIAVLTGRLTDARATKLDNLDVAVSSRLDTTHFDTRSLLANEYATAATQSSIVDLLDTEVAYMMATLQKLDSTLEADGANFRFTVAALANAPTGGGGGGGFTSDDRTKLETLHTHWTAVRAAKIDNLDVAVSSRMATFVYVSPDNTGIAELNTKLTSDRALKLDNLNATISSRMATFTYTAPDNTGIAELNTKLTDTRAGKIDNLDVAVSSRGTGDATVAGQNAIGAAVLSRLAAADYVEPYNAGIQTVLKLLQADVVVDTNVSPWELVWKERGTETELMRQSLRDVVGTGITSTAATIGQAVQP